MDDGLGGAHLGSAAPCELQVDEVERAVGVRDLAGTVPRRLGPGFDPGAVDLGQRAGLHGRRESRPGSLRPGVSSTNAWQMTSRQ